MQTWGLWLNLGSNQDKATMGEKIQAKLAGSAKTYSGKSTGKVRKGKERTTNGGVCSNHRRVSAAPGERGGDYSRGYGLGTPPSGIKRGDRIAGGKEEYSGKGKGRNRGFSALDAEGRSDPKKS